MRYTPLRRGMNELEVVALTVWKICTDRGGRSRPWREIPTVEGDPERGGIPRREAARDPDTRGVSRHTRCGFHIRHSPPSSIYITLPFRKSHSNARPGAQSLGNSFIIIICCQSMCQSLYCLNNKFWSV